jgi:hypothetical protein
MVQKVVESILKAIFEIIFLSIRFVACSGTKRNYNLWSDGILFSQREKNAYQISADILGSESILNLTMYRIPQGHIIITSFKTQILFMTLKKNFW